MNLLAITSFSNAVFSQSQINGIINEYAKVDAIGIDYVTISDESQFDQFQVNDTVLLIQMKGVRIDGKYAPVFGDSGFSYGEAGKHEFLTILDVDDITNRITFKSDLKYPAFDPGSYLQLIKVPSYLNAIVTGGILTCDPWNSISGTGGVLAVIIRNTLTLNDNIDITGKGFKGGSTASGLGFCRISDTRPDQEVFSGTSDSAGYKGEGLSVLADPWGDFTPPFYSIEPFNSKGQGKNFNGGGGGNGKYSGGGGGSNYGAGGIGGKETNSCSPTYAGGSGGIDVSTTGLDGGLFLGGGGGASTYMTGTPTAGGNGGGLLILLCDTIKGNGHEILADGATPAGIATGEAGAGGGGGGGSIALYIQNYSTSSLTISAKGGNGGDNDPVNSLFGEGGGGGGGFLTANSVIPANVNAPVLTGGSVGKRRGLSTGTGGAAGNSITNFVPVLNGFLFNSISSSATGTQIDSICSNITPKKIVGTQPAGTGPFTYLWQKSYNLAGSESDITGATSKDLTFSEPETNTFWIRRVVTDPGATPDAIVDTSKWVNIIVQPAITGNLVGKDTTICYNQNPLALAGTGTPSGGYGKINYHWLQNNDNNWTSYVNADGTDSTKADFNPSALIQTTYYKRKVTSGHCVNTSSTVIITVLPSITGNTLSPDTVICEGSLFNVLGATPAENGSGSYVYQWQDSTATGTWQPATGTNVNQTYTPDTAQFATLVDRFFRRVVYSGPDSVCRSNSIPRRLTRWHKIKNNTISSPDNTICSGEIPVPLTGTTPVNGDGTYAFQWQDSTAAGTWQPATGSNITQTYSPPALTDATWYRRIVNSSVCSNTSNNIFINVHDPITNYNIAGDTTICNGAIPQKIRGQKASGGNGTFAYQWFYSDNIGFTPKIPVPVTGTAEDFTPVVLTQDTYYMREVTSGECFETSNKIKVTVLPLISNNIITPVKPMICFNTVPGQIMGSALTGGAGGTPVWIWEQSADGSIWVAAAGTNNQQNYSPPNPQTAKIWYRRIIMSGLNNCCIDTSSTITIDIDPLPTGTISNVSDTTICNGSQVQLKVHLEGAASWTIVYLENTTQVTVNNIGASDVLINRIPLANASLSTFNYSLLSVQDNNGCLATSLTGAKKADVYRIPDANAGPDGEICGPEYTFAAIRSNGNGTWTWEPSAPVLAPYPEGSDGRVIIDSSFTSAEVAYKFYWEEKNWLCADKDSVTVTFYNRIDTISAGADTAIFTFDFKTKMNAYPVKSHETGLWTVVNGNGDFESNSANSTVVKNIAAGLNTYKWLVTNNGFCTVEDLIKIDVASALIPEGISPDGDLINDELIIKGLDLDDHIADLTIINGAGSQVFKTSNRDGKNNWSNWDGKDSKGTEMPEGTYYYLLKVESPSTDKVVQKSGFIILKRH